ncbi:phosphoenolpyruvate--protein phosphotransferase [Candidatus Amarolinea dominans]|uniref:phosphoenolpyruvate--protein phosphotransferase n=1 Tax=Candidatus Amarolinea dominans TaxID=3140696 RepID=UPI003136431F|nr:phosphoenolpyruvate--protein phosphotransferase [Anaerolineae bacterium]
MVGLVIVSHSYFLAQGVLELARQMAAPGVKIAAAGGLDGPDHALGTDPFMVQQAIEAVDGPDGVLVLMDLGSAILSTEMALEFVTEETRQRVLLCEAPLVEGALAAAVQAGLGSSLAVTAAEARSALLPKATHLGVQIAGPVVSSPVSTTERVIQLRLTVRNRLGLHARPAALFVRTVGRFASSMTVRNVTRGGPAVNARSINLVATQGIRQGDEIEIGASGADAEAALAALAQLADTGFGDGITPVDSAAPSPAGAVSAAPALTAASADLDEPLRSLQGIAAAPGIAIGPVRRFEPTVPPVVLRQRGVSNPAAEWERLQGARQVARQNIEEMHARLWQQGAAAEAAIFDAHLLFLDDPALLEPAQAAIFGQADSAEAAWHDIIETTAAAYAALDDAYLQARAADVRDVGRQVLLALAGQRATFSLDAPAILVADDLAPSDTANLDRSQVLALCTARGGSTSHSAILARTLGIPAVVGLGARVLAVPTDTLMVVNGDSGEVIIAPAPAAVATWEARRSAWLDARQQAAATSQQAAVTTDGMHVEVVANIGSVADALAAVAAGAEGVGLLRTEFLYLDRAVAPSEAEQTDIYRAIFAVMGQRPIVVRTLDVGGDKELAYIALGHEDNPFLGTRAVRLYRERPDLIEPQLRALLRAAVGRRVRIMFPMIATYDEVVMVRGWLDKAQRDLAAAGVPAPTDLQVGIMIEIPAAAVLADKLAPAVDFFSIGTNDLTQYTMAAERGNPRVAYLTDALHPAVLRLIAQVITAAHDHGRWVGVCGELAGDLTAIPILLGLGLDEFSMNPAAIPPAKQLLRTLNRQVLRDLASHVLMLNSAQAVRAAVRAALPAG